MGFLDRYSTYLNDAVARSAVGRYFHLEGSGHQNEIKGARFVTEMRAGLTTFATMAYIIAVNVRKAKNHLYSMLISSPGCHYLRQRRALQVSRDSR